MIDALFTTLLLPAPPASTGLLLAAGRSADNGNGTMILGAAITLGFLALIATLMHFGYRRLQRHWHHSHPALFHGLCDAHELDRNSRRLLQQVVRFHRLAQPARLFTEPEWLDPARLRGPLQTRTEELATLRSRLFSVSVPGTR